MSAHLSDPALLVLHAVRLGGMADAATVARRFDLDLAMVEEALLDEEAVGRLRNVGTREMPAWHLTDAGRAVNVAQLGAELERTGTRPTVRAAHADFLELNGRFLVACTDWQIRPARGEPLAANDHTDWRWDERVLDELGTLGRRMRPIAARLAGALRRFDGYGRRYEQSLGRVERGERRWVDEPGIDSCHSVWFELHEDLLATLGLERGHEA